MEHSFDDDFEDDEGELEDEGTSKHNSRGFDNLPRILMSTTADATAWSLGAFGTERGGTPPIVTDDTPPPRVGMVSDPTAESESGRSRSTVKSDDPELDDGTSMVVSRSFSGTTTCSHSQNPTTNNDKQSIRRIKNTKE